MIKNHEKSIPQGFSNYHALTTSPKSSLKIYNILQTKNVKKQSTTHVIINDFTHVNAQYRYLRSPNPNSMPKMNESKLEKRR